MGGEILEALEEYRRFAGATAGKCLGLAMSGDQHPDPDAVLIGIFEESQALAARWRPVLAKALGQEGGAL